MKKSVLLLFVILSAVSYANAVDSSKSVNIFGHINRFDNAVTFYEKGIRFDVFLNGDFDFDTRFFRTRRNRRIQISRDFQGRVNRVGSVSIRYDYQGNVRRIGRVSMSYRSGFLRRVGNLRIQYNTWGRPSFYGNVGFDDFYTDFYYGNNFNPGFNWNIGAICVYNDPYFYGNEFKNYYRRVREDANYIYYRANDGAQVSRDRVLRRRKNSSSNVRSDQNLRNNGRKNTQSRTTVTRMVPKEPLRKKTEFGIKENYRKNNHRKSSVNRKTRTKKKPPAKRKAEIQKRNTSKNLRKKS